jgi:hypothetical protein
MAAGGFLSCEEGTMRRILIVSLLLNAALVAGLCYKEMAANAEGGGAANCPQIKTGNVNEDANLDISDAVYILNFLFTGGPGPVPEFVADWGCVTTLEEELVACKAARDTCAADLLACQAARDAALSDLAACTAARDTALGSLATCETERASCLTSLDTCQTDLALCVQPPATGQTTCYDVAGAVIDCASTAYPGQDGFYRIGCPTAARFVDNQDGTVTDKCTGLMWQKNTAPGSYLWQAALGYCDGLELAGHSDWRLPNLRELRTLVDYGGRVPAIDPVFQAVADVYWTSSTYNAILTHAWAVSFEEGEGNFHEAKVDPFPVRAVRGAP